MSGGRRAPSARAQEGDELVRPLELACQVRASFLGRPDVARLLPEIEAAVLGAKLTPTEGARRLLALLDEHGGGEAAPVSRRTRAS